LLLSDWSILNNKFLEPFDLAVVGGGAAGFMTAITAAENGVKRIIILEGTSKLMEKVRISGGGRCNVTNATWIPNELVDNYPRGGIQLLESFNRFAAGDVYDWFEKKGLKLKIEEDLRVFPVSNSSSEVSLMEPRSFDEMPQAIQALRERKTVILNLTMMDPDQAQRAVDFIAGGTYAIDGHQERVGESIFLFAPSCVNVTSSSPEEASPSSGSIGNAPKYSLGKNTTPEPAWGNSKLSAY